MGSSSFKNAVLKKTMALKKQQDQKQVKPSKKRNVSSKKVKNERKKIQKLADDLDWKPVEIPETMDDYEGFYGLEELDGTGVEVVNGKIQFKPKEESKKSDKNEKKKKDPAAAKKEKKDESGDIDDADIAWDGAELTGVDFREDKDIPEIPGSKNKKTEEKKAAKQKKQNGQKKEKLSERTFSAMDSSKLDELISDDIDLPGWKDVPLSAYIQNSLSKLKFQTPTEIQKATIPLAVAGKDVIGKAMTGSGKTLAYGIPILEKALAKETDHPAAIIFTPTRELATQVTKHLQKLVKFTPLHDKSIVPLTGGLSIQKQEKRLQHNPKIVVATPGRILELLEKSTDLAKQLAATDMLVYDEADRLVEDGHFDELDKIIDILRNCRKEIKSVPHRWQTLVYSATFSKELFGKLDKDKKPMGRKRKAPEGEGEEGDLEREAVLELLGKKLRFNGKPEYIDVNPTEKVASKVTEALLPCEALERDLMLYYFLLIFPGNTLVFANSIDSVKRLKPMLNALKIPSVSLHSSMIQKQRLRSLEQFQANCEKAGQQNKSSVLIASDVAARGLDIPGIQHVVHYHLPRSADTYIHRSGRTARAGKEGVSLVLASPQEASGPLHKLRKLVAKNNGEPEELKLLPVDTYILDQLKERMDIAAQLAKAEIAGSSANKEKNWVQKAAEELGLEDLSDLEEDDYLKRDRRRLEDKQLSKSESKALRGELNQLLATPVRKGRSSYLTSGLTNMAEVLLKSENQNNTDIMSYLQQDALKTLKKSRKH